MKGKYKATGCAKFFLALVILAPLAYIGASYYNGEDGIKNIKEIVSKEGKSESGSLSDDVYKLKNQVSKYRKDAEFFEKEKNRLEKELEACRNAK